MNPEAERWLKQAEHDLENAETSFGEGCGTCALSWLNRPRRKR